MMEIKLLTMVVAPHVLLIMVLSVKLRLEEVHKLAQKSVETELKLQLSETTVTQLMVMVVVLLVLLKLASFVLEDQVQPKTYAKRFVEMASTSRPSNETMETLLMAMGVLLHVSSRSDTHAQEALLQLRISAL